MYINEFGQQVKPDWVSFSVSKDQLVTLSSTIFRAMIRDSSINVELGIDEEISEVVRITITNAKEEHLEPIKKAMGVKAVFLNDSIVFQDTYAKFAFERLQELMLGTSGSYVLDQDGDFILSINFDDYIRETFQL